MASEPCLILRLFSVGHQVCWHASRHCCYWQGERPVFRERESSPIEQQIEKLFLCKRRSLLTCCDLELWLCQNSSYVSWIGRWRFFFSRGDAESRNLDLRPSSECLTFIFRKVVNIVSLYPGTVATTTHKYELWWIQWIYRYEYDTIDQPIIL